MKSFDTVLIAITASAAVFGRKALLFTDSEVALVATAAIIRDEGRSMTQENGYGALFQNVRRDGPQEEFPHR